MLFQSRTLAALGANLRIGFFSLLILLGAPTQATALDVGKSQSGSPSADLNLEDVERFAAILSQVHRYYVEPVEDKTLLNYAVAGMLSNLDPHSEYLDEAALKDLEATTSGKFDGIGIEILPSDGFIKVISPIDEMPAYKAGIKAGDLIVRIDDKLVRDMTLGQAIDMIRGESGTKVHLTILRKDVKKPLEFSVVRETIKIKTVKTERLLGNYGYIRLSFFQDTTQSDLVKAIKKLQKSGPPLQGVILDLRNNPGGLLDSAVDVTGQFLESKSLKYGGLIVYTKGRIPSADIEAKATGRDILQGIPMVVMINEGSASAAEIVAGALQDQKRAKLLGQKSFGKGSVQTILGIDDKSAVKLTTALYYTPAGRSIQAKGIEPDIQVSDIAIPKPVVTDEALLSMSEASLEKHLPPTDVKGAAKYEATAREIQQKKDDLLYSDFQLYEALNILQGLKTSAF